MGGRTGNPRCVGASRTGNQIGRNEISLLSEMQESKRDGEARTECSQQVVAGSSSSCGVLEHEKGRWSRHIAVLAKYPPGMLESWARKSERDLDRLEHLTAARMHNDAVEVVQAETVPGEESVQRGPKLMSGASRYVRAQNHAKPIVLDRPARHVFSFTPHMLADRLNTGRGSAAGYPTEDNPGRAVAEQSGRDVILDATIDRSAVDRAQFHDQQQDNSVGQSLRHACSTRKARYPARATKAKDWQALYAGRQLK